MALEALVSDIAEPTIDLEMAICRLCGSPIGTEKYIREVEAALGRSHAASLPSLRWCERCKVTRAQSGPQPASGKASGGPSVARDLSRRDSFGTVAFGLAGIAALIGAARNAFASTPAATAKKRRYGMVIDTRSCVGCDACMVACKAENKTPPGVNYMLVTKNSLGGRPDDKPVFTPKPCFHCENPPCVDVCPASATFKRQQDGIVVVDYDRCIGCRYCQTACPYGARYFDFGENYDPMTPLGAYASLVPSPEYKQFRTRHEGASPMGNVSKCTFCIHLQDENGLYDKNAGRWPSCAKTCTGRAIHFGDLNDPDSDVSRLNRERQPIRLKDELGTEPNVSYLF